ncbi:MAG: endonuclease/exonuclease/phosphatase family protein, partial [Candidatus Doudnabacteria bacterium]|nr:endonuclease/exonuclease/phosphatase family protein [Candidatus Doudnabacteria bacterium]
MMSIIKAIVGFPFHLLKGILQALAVVLLVASTLVLIGGYFGEGIGANHDWGSMLDILSHLRMVALTGQLISFILFIILRDVPWVFAAIISLGFNLSEIAPYYIPQQKPFSAEAGSLKILQWNVYQENRSFNGIVSYIKETKPDIIGLQEVDQLWLTQLNVPLRNYPYRVLVPQNNNFGIALYSKLPITAKQVRAFDEPPKPTDTSGFDLQHFDPQKAAAQVADRIWNQIFPDSVYPSIVATINYRNQPVTVVVTHPVPPFPSFDMRNKQLHETAIFVGRLHQPVILMGDLNCSPWSVYYKAFLKNSGLKDSQMGFGIQPSWPNYVNGP